MVGLCRAGCEHTAWPWSTAWGCLLSVKKIASGVRIEKKSCIKCFFLEQTVAVVQTLVTIVFLMISKFCFWMRSRDESLKVGKLIIHEGKMTLRLQLKKTASSAFFGAEKSAARRSGISRIWLLVSLVFKDGNPPRFWARNRRMISEDCWSRRSSLGSLEAKTAATRDWWADRVRKLKMLHGNGDEWPDLEMISQMLRFNGRNLRVCFFCDCHVSYYKPEGFCRLAVEAGDLIIRQVNESQNQLFLQKKASIPSESSCSSYHSDSTDLTDSGSFWDWKYFSAQDCEWWSQRCECQAGVFEKLQNLRQAGSSRAASI